MHRKINDVITIVVVCLGIYIIALPLAPMIVYWWQSQQGFSTPLYISSTKQPVPKENRLIIPSIGINELIIENKNTFNSSGGVLRLPQSKTPDKKGNSVMIGHRFSHLPTIATPFYHLDKVQLGGKMYITWNEKIYTYIVQDIKVVPPSEVSIEAPSPTKKLTLYTCTPIWTAKDRLVVIGTPYKNQETL